MINIIKTSAIFILVILCLFLGISLYQEKAKLCFAQDYIEQLESDHPDYLDTTSGSDAYTNYYSVVK